MNHIAQQWYSVQLLLCFSGCKGCRFQFYLFAISLVFLHLAEQMPDRQTDRQTGGQRVRRTDLIFHCQLGQSSPSRPLSPDHIATYGQSPGLQTKPFSPDSRANVRWSQVEARSQLPRPRHGAEHPRGRWLCVCSGARGWVRILALSSALYGRL